MESYHIVWSDIDSKVVPVDPADCPECQGLAPNPCFNHFQLGAEFHK